MRYLLETAAVLVVYLGTAILWITDTVPWLMWPWIAVAFGTLPAIGAYYAWKHLQGVWRGPPPH